jgi:hypothetical protein
MHRNNHVTPHRKIGKPSKALSPLPGQSAKLLQCLAHQQEVALGSFPMASPSRECYCTTAASPTARNVRAITIEQIIAQYAITGQIDLLKCDIEGGETELFAHCDSWIHRVGTAVIEVHGRFSVDDLMGLLRDKGVGLAPQRAAKPDLCILKLMAPQ